MFPLTFFASVSEYVGSPISLCQPLGIALSASGISCVNNGIHMDPLFEK